MSVTSALRASFRLRPRSTAALVRVDGQEIRIGLAERPPVGSKLDVGFPVIVTESKQVAGGGILIAADRIDEEVVQAPHRDRRGRLVLGVISIGIAMIAGYLARRLASD
jgi:hypothetical protein